MLLPLVERGRMLGVLMLATSRSGRTYGEADLVAVQRLADRVSLAIQNARLYAEATRRAREEQALREAVAAVSAAFTTEGVIRSIAESALIATGAHGAFVERIDIHRRRSVVVAAAGERVPPIGAEAALDGSFAADVLARPQAVVIPDLARAERGLPGDLAATCRGCTAVVNPLLDAGEAIGTMVVLRTGAGAAFREDEVERSRAFAELAALAFRKVHLLEEAQRRREELEKLAESRAHLVRGFSHDVRNPLGAADLHLQAMAADTFGELPEAQRESVATIRRSLQRALDLMGELVGIARDEAPALTIERRPTDVRWAAEEVCEEYRAQARAKGLELRCVAVAPLPLIASDPARVRQVLGNLVSNAIKYTDRGQVVVTVEERSGAGRPGRWIATDVADTGPGIPLEQRGAIFEEFRRFAPGARPGHGVGLAIARRIAEAMGGAITVESEPGRGSTFTLWIPV
jgi:signal transduction histidine kinase